MGTSMLPLALLNSSTPPYFSDFGTSASSVSHFWYIPGHTTQGLSTRLVLFTSPTLWRASWASMKRSRTWSLQQDLFMISDMVRSRMPSNRSWWSSAGDLIMRFPRFLTTQIYPNASNAMGYFKKRLLLFFRETTPFRELFTGNWMWTGWITSCAMRITRVLHMGPSMLTGLSGTPVCLREP